MNASENIDNLIADLKDWRGTTLGQIRKIIHKADPDMVEEWKWMGTPVWSHDGIVCIANAFKDKVKLTFQEGASLADPDKLYNAGLAGNKWRTIDFHKDAQIREGPLEALIKSAVAYNRDKAHSKRTARRRAADAQKK